MKDPAVSDKSLICLEMTQVLTSEIHSRAIHLADPVETQNLDRDLFIDIHLVGKGIPDDDDAPFDTCESVNFFLATQMRIGFGNINRWSGERLKRDRI
jgi:hypothetical protein